MILDEKKGESGSITLVILKLSIPPSKLFNSSTNASVVHENVCIRGI